MFIKVRINIKHIFILKKIVCTTKKKLTKAVKAEKISHTALRAKINIDLHWKLLLPLLPLNI